MTLMVVNILSTSMELRISSMNVVGDTKGTVMCHTAWMPLAPSMVAASSTSSEMFWMPPR